jgi:very-short-patch-repair endonuclease
MMRVDPPEFVARLGGIAHRRALYEAGASRETVRASLRRSELVAVRRDWVATPTCPTALRRAVQIGARLTCLSAAAHLELWMIGDGRFHVAAPPTASRLALTSATTGPPPELVHWAAPPVSVTTRVAIDPIENVLAAVARCQPHENAVAVIDSALNRKLVHRAQLVELAAKIGGRFAETVADPDGRADSGLETLPRLRLARRGVVMVPQARLDGHRVDGLIGDRLVLQFDGDRFHSTKEQRRRDREEDARLVLQGYAVLRYGFEDVMHHWERTEAQILSAMAQGLHRRTGSSVFGPVLP